MTPRTRAICVVHYAGVGCAMDVITPLGREAGVPVIEDAAQGILAMYRGRPLGSLGSLAALSFHETKNVHCGEGGALVVNDSTLADRAEVIHEKGTNRRRFLRGQVDKYTWVDIGSSFALSEINSAFLWAQLEHAEEITRRRLEIWNAYHAAFAELEERGALRRPVIPIECAHNAHMYYVLLPNSDARANVLARLNERGVNAVFHYAPLHTSNAGRRYTGTKRELPVTDESAARLIRLPLWPGMDESEIAQVIDGLASAVSPRPARA
jgi:dTDP-4-amino-4,6-dideoxygalactose transaminase